nr:MAG TPA: hypothetical protein [Caudoviricetes sp.]
MDRASFFCKFNLYSCFLAKVWDGDSYIKI